MSQAHAHGTLHVRRFNMTMLLLVLQINAVTSAEANQTSVEHPMLSQVRACSTTPEAAVSFFTAILHPKPSARLTSLQALDHPYIRQCVHQMQDHYNPPPLDPPRSWEERLHQDRLEQSAGHSRMLRSLGMLGKAAGLAGFAVVKSVATAVTGKRQQDMSQYFPEYTHPERDFDLLTGDLEERMTIRDLSLSVNPQQSSAGTSDAGPEKVPQPQADPLLQGNASAAAVGVNQELLAAACIAVNRQRPALVARSQVRMPALKANKRVLFDPLQRPGARLHRHPHHNFSARTGRSAPIADSGTQQVPDAAVAYAAASPSAAAAAAATEAQGAVATGRAENQLPIIAGSSAETAKTAVSDSTGFTTPSEVHASIATGQSCLPAVSAGGQAEPVTTQQSTLPAAQGTGHEVGDDAAGQSAAESSQQGCVATADSGSLSAKLASGSAGADSTRQVTSGTAAAVKTTAAQHSSASPAASINMVASVNGATSDSVKSHVLPMAAEVCGLTLAQQNLQSHQIELLPEDEEEFCQVPQQLQELPSHPMPPLENVGGPIQTHNQTQPEGVQRHAVSSLYNATEQKSDIADVSSQQVSVATAGNAVAGGALSGPFSSSDGQNSGLFIISGEGQMDMEDDAHREAGCCNAPALYIEDTPVVR